VGKIVEILGFLGAMRDYSYIDRLSTALDETSVYETLKDAIRAYLSLCHEEKEVEYKNKVYICPDVAGDELEKEVSEVKKSVKGKTGAEIVKFSRELAMQAYATIPKIVVREKK